MLTFKHVLLTRQSEPAGNGSVSATPLLRTQFETLLLSEVDCPQGSLSLLILISLPQVDCPEGFETLLLIDCLISLR